MGAGELRLSLGLLPAISTLNLMPRPATRTGLWRASPAAWRLCWWKSENPPSHLKLTRRTPAKYHSVYTDTCLIWLWRYISWAQSWRNLSDAVICLYSIHILEEMQSVFMEELLDGLNNHPGCVNISTIFFSLSLLSARRPAQPALLWNVSDWAQCLPVAEMK